jgi:hypothetical protein
VESTLNKLELMSQLFEIAMRINLETEMACFVTISGHVEQFTVAVCKHKKDHYTDKISSHEFYYERDYGDKSENDKEFCELVHAAIQDLNSILSRTFTKKYTAWCNLIDMACSQVFTSEIAAKQWVKKMNTKYKKVHAIVGYKEELI